MRRIAIALLLLLLTPALAWADLPEILKAAAGYDSKQTLAEMLAEDAGLVHYAHPENGWTPLHYAAMEARRENVRLLLDSGADIHGRREEQTALHSAVARRHPDGTHTDAEGRAIVISMQRRRDDRVNVVRFLIERGADVNAPGYQGQGPLAVAAGYGMPEVLTVLIEAGAAVNPANAERTGGASRPLYQALAQGLVDNANLLLDHGAEVGAYTNARRVDPLLSVAVREAPPALIRRMLTAGADPHHPAAISMAATYDRLDIVELLAAAMDLGERRQAALDHAITAAASARHDDIVAFLEKQGASVEAKRRGLTFAIHGQIWAGNVADVGELAAMGAPLDAYVLAALGRLDALKALADDEPPIATLRTAGRQATPLHAAAACGRIDVVTWLLTKGAKVGDTSRSGHTALHLAASGGHDELVKLLLEHEADVHTQLEGLYVDSHYTPLSLASKHGHGEVVFRLLRAGARIEHEHAAFGKLFVEAHESRQRALVDLLSRPAAEPRVRALVDWARQCGNEQADAVLAALRAAGADF